MAPARDVRKEITVRITAGYKNKRIGVKLHHKKTRRSGFEFDDKAAPAGMMGKIVKTP